MRGNPPVHWTFISADIQSRKGYNGVAPFA
ncbi:unnamed protein product [Acanthoscelides obtectus]|uniref:Uncharacterized protein n=1 Tax=Acanthoscelides obtectus TaxID=200917 RepID=A0A9P0KW15_ACAOB|nr:unnamed protein product [Acanthoscelides obtectus]CAK1637874.1 hypothetical protein AOBTE_LOCUS10253 [Acanthoscelides obtectus]